MQGGASSLRSRLASAGQHVLQEHATCPCAGPFPCAKATKVCSGIPPGPGLFLLHCPGHRVPGFKGDGSVRERAEFTVRREKTECSTLNTGEGRVEAGSGGPCFHPGTSPRLVFWGVYHGRGAVYGDLERSRSVLAKDCKTD